MGIGGGIVGLVILVLDILAIVQIAKSPATSLAKALWIVAIIVLPVIGLLVWFFVGPRAPK